ncbi:50S ribosomal protein L18 [Fluviispira multicolorata]|uniref:Large ribosomal subunit protein uL18 n=1 Tax=Fluviispira multicolorata TaxID=2654512 RepID=A0A833JBP2_9BACT|nr:50S ribosomal protein L18 [Fluviispira multicolorata]KAB8029751.1 50S ribosomal protein L18 [Fluviispira multicolorata]
MYRIINRRRVRQLRKMRFWRRRSTDLTKPRLCIFRSSRHIQAQVIDDAKGIVLACASSIEADVKSTGLRGKEMAVKVGAVVAERAKNAGVTTVVFDRNGFTYHGRVQVLADSAREAGLQF